MSTSALRFATFNTALSRPRFNALKQALSRPYQDRQARYVAEVIQRVRPDVLVLQEFDYDPLGLTLQYFREHYLQQPQRDSCLIVYPYYYAVPSNTGRLSEVDLNRDGKLTLPQDGQGFAQFAGQYAFAILSRYPLDFRQYRSFQTFLWADLPMPQFPICPTTQTIYYDDSAQQTLRLSSKNHVDIVAKTPLGEIHLIAAHPTPPAFDGEERRNQWRNFAELRLLAEYLNNADFLYDDQGRYGGLASDAPFILAGDLNADPSLGNSIQGAIQQLLHHPRVHPDVAIGKHLPRHATAPYTHTFFAGKLTLQLDYVLPSREFKVLGSGVFAPTAEQEGYYLVRYNNSSDHRLVWVDVTRP